MVDRSNQARGAWGERLAAAWYQRHGYAVLDRNWRTTHGELDLVVTDGEVVVFCEVKTRRSDRFGGAAAAVGPAKQRTIRRLASEWLAVHRGQRGFVPVRFDVVAVTGTCVEVIESAF